MKKLLALLLALVMVFALVACGTSNTPDTPNVPSSNTPGADKPVEPEFVWNVSFSYGEATAKYTVQYLEQISEKSGGRIDFEYYYSNSLISIPEIPKALKDGIRSGDIAGAITQNPVAMGYMTVEAAVKLMNGEDLGTNFIDSGFAWYNADNMDDPAIAPCLYD